MRGKGNSIREQQYLIYRVKKSREKQNLRQPYKGTVRLQIFCHFIQVNSKGANYFKTLKLNMHVKKFPENH